MNQDIVFRESSFWTRRSDTLQAHSSVMAPNTARSTRRLSLPESPSCLTRLSCKELLRGGVFRPIVGSSWSKERNMMKCSCRCRRLVLASGSSVGSHFHSQLSHREEGRLAGGPLGKSTRKVFFPRKTWSDSDRNERLDCAIEGIWGLILCSQAIVLLQGFGPAPLYRGRRSMFPTRGCVSTHSSSQILSRSSLGSLSKRLDCDMVVCGWWRGVCCVLMG